MTDQQEGSSPLTRGKPLHCDVPSHCEGLIPAHAGKTPTPDTREEPEAAHPRSRGENRDSHATGEIALGSSPLTRGKLGRGPGGAGCAGLIPAHAGKTISASASEFDDGAHPRSRGENIKAAVSVVVEWGSSPLTRGKRRHPRRARHLQPAHPRSRGENWPGRDRGTTRRGSSPLTRGKLRGHG